MSLRLTFRTIECQGYGAMRQATLPCSDCGARPAQTETDRFVQQRIRAVELARSERFAVVTPPVITGVQLLDSDETYSLPDRLMAAASLVAGGHESGAEDLAQIAREIAELEAWTEHAPEYRPLRRHTTVVKELLRNLVRAFDVVLQALVAPSMAEAQALARELQSAIDGAVAANNEGADLLGVLREVAEAANPVSRATCGGSRPRLKPRNSSASFGSTPRPRSMAPP